jgi:hypothetical protein
MIQAGRTLILIGLMLVGVGLLMQFGGRLPFRIGRLPGDFVLKGKNSTFYFPLMTCLVLSAVLSVVSWLVSRR